METSQEIGFTRKFEAAVALVESLKSIVVNTALDHKNADDKLKLAREYRAALKKEYDENLVVLEAKRIQGAKVKLDADLEGFIKGLKNGAMLSFERAEEKKRVDEENRLAAIAQAEIDKENARLQKIADDEKEAADKEIRRLAGIAARTKDAAKKLQMERDAADAVARQEIAAAEQQRVKDEAAAAPKVVVVLERTAPKAAHRGISKKWSIKTASGKTYTSEDFQKTLRIPATEFPGIDPKFLMLNHTAITGITDSLGNNHGIPGVNYWEVDA